MQQLTLAEYNAIHRDFRGVWDTERTDWADWPKVREKYMGKRTMMSGDGTCSLLIEGLHFEIVDAPEAKAAEAKHWGLIQKHWHSS